MKYYKHKNKKILYANGDYILYGDEIIMEDVIKNIAKTNLKIIDKLISHSSKDDIFRKLANTSTTLKHREGYYSSSKYKKHNVHNLLIYFILNYNRINNYYFDNTKYYHRITRKIKNKENLYRINKLIIELAFKDSNFNLESNIYILESFIKQCDLDSMFIDTILSSHKKNSKKKTVDFKIINRLAKNKNIIKFIPEILKRNDVDPGSCGKIIAELIKVKNVKSIEDLIEVAEELKEASKNENSI